MEVDHIAREKKNEKKNKKNEEISLKWRLVLHIVGEKQTATFEGVDVYS